MGEEEILGVLKVLNNIGDIKYSYCILKIVNRMKIAIDSPFFLYAKYGDGRIMEDIVLEVRNFIYWVSECFIENGDPAKDID